MQEMLVNLWNAVKSGDVQAVLAVCFAILAATCPIWIKLVNSKVTKWKYRFDAAKEEAKHNFDKANDITKQSQDLMQSMGAFINESNESFQSLAELMTYIIDHSTLTDSQKAYAKETYIKKIGVAEPVKIEEVKPIEEPKVEEVKPIEEKKEEVKQETEEEPIAL